MTVAKEWFASAETSFTLTDSDLDLGNVNIEYLKYRPVNVSAVASEDMSSVNVSWANADAAVALRVDDGTVASPIGIENATDQTVLGTVYREPVVLDGISWYQTYAGGPHYYVRLMPEVLTIMSLLMCSDLTRTVTRLVMCFISKK